MTTRHSHALPRMWAVGLTLLALIVAVLAAPPTAAQSDTVAPIEDPATDTPSPSPDPSTEDTTSPADPDAEDPQDQTPLTAGPEADDPVTAPPEVEDPPSGETTRVIVELATPTRPLAELAPPEEAAQQQAIADTQAEVAAGLDGTGTEVVAAFDHVPGMAVEASAEGLDELWANPDVAAVRIDGVARLLLDASTALVRADEAWPTADGTGYSVAVLDTGVDGGHAFLDDNTVVHEACFADDTTANNSPAGDCPNGQNTQTGPGAAGPCAFIGCDHGTHVAGIVASDGDPGSNGVSYPGVARGTGIVAEQVFHVNSGTAVAYFSDIVEALDDVYTVRDAYNVAAVNMSFGGSQFGGYCDGQVEPLMFQSVQNLKDEGVATVVAAGNTGSTTSLSFPACLSNVISVSSVVAGGGAVAGNANVTSFLDLLAPGTPVTSASPGGSNAITTKSGTSMAAPHVAGAVAVLRQAGVGGGVAEVDLVDHLHGVIRAAGPCVRGPTGVRFARLDVKAAIDWTAAPSAFFSDIDCGTWFEKAADWLGFDPDGPAGPIQPLATGYPDGTFGGNLPITRGQDARMLYRLFGEPGVGGYAHGFVDVPLWIVTAVNWINWPGGPTSPQPLMTGYGSDFRPNDNITRAQKARQLYRAAGSPDPNSRGCPGHGFSDVPPWVEVAVRWISCPAFGPGGVTPIATGYLDRTFRPNNSISRAEAARMLQRFNDAGYVV